MTDLWTIQHSHSVNPNCGQPRWLICLNGTPVSDDHPAEPPRELAALLADLPAPTSADGIDFGIADRTHDRWHNVECAIVRSRFDQSVEVPRRGRFEISMGLSLGCVPSLVSIWAGDNMAPTLGAALHRHYGDGPVPDPIKALTPAEKQKSAEQAEEQAKLQAIERRRAALLNDVARIVKAKKPDAEKLVLAIGELLH
jgi:hypothetical protein